MPSQAVTNLTDQVTRATTVTKSATALIDGITTRIDEAVAAAIANGATEAELAPLVALSTDLDNASTALAASVQANTPAASQPA